MASQPAAPATPATTAKRPPTPPAAAAPHRSAQAAVAHTTALLAARANIRVLPEHLRAAKFNHEGAAAPLWRALYQCMLVRFSGAPLAASEARRAEALWNDRSSARDAAFAVCHWLGHEACPALLAPDPGSAAPRRVLLAFLWVLARTDVFARGPRALPPYPPDTSLLTGPAASMRRARADAAAACTAIASSPATVEIRLRQIEALYGRLALTLRSIEAATEAYTTLLARVQQSAPPSLRGRPDAAYLLHLARSKAAVQQHVQTLDAAVRALSRDAQGHASEFWTWASALPALDAGQALVPPAPRPDIPIPPARVSLDDVTTARAAAHATLAPVRPAADRVRAAWAHHKQRLGPAAFARETDALRAQMPVLDGETPTLETVFRSALAQCPNTPVDASALPGMLPRIPADPGESGLSGPQARADALLVSQLRPARNARRQKFAKELGAVGNPVVDRHGAVLLEADP